MERPAVHKRPVPRWQSTTVLVVGILVSVFLWRALNRHEEIYLHANAEQQAQSIQREVIARMDARVGSLVRLARWSGRTDDASRVDWENDASILFAQDGGYQAIERVGPDGQIQWVVPSENNTNAIGFNMLHIPERARALNLARAERRVTTTRQTVLSSGGEGFLVVAPIYQKEQFLGWVTGVFRTRDLLATILRTIPLQGYELSIANPEQMLYNVGGDLPVDGRPVGHAQVLDYGLNWQIHAWPSRALYRQEKSIWPHGVLLIGVVMSALLSTSIQLAQVSRQRTRDAERLNEELNEEIQQRLLVEQELARAAEQLQTSNRELQDFASVASHDLQEPLRKIQAFGDRLRDKCSDALSENGRDYLNRMQNAARRMQTLINDLLTFSRVTSKAQPFNPTDLNEVARDVVSDLEVRLEQTGGAVELEPLPMLDADELQMRQLLQNLISNGLKFRRPGVPPVVRVGGTVRHEPQLEPVEVADGERAAHNGDGTAHPDADHFPGEGPHAAPDDQEGEEVASLQRPIGSDQNGAVVEIFVQDNGIGFDEKYLDRIFTVFQRLHGRTEYEGTGIGLAVCRKIAERHGGSITATSRPGEGSRFVITLPQHHHPQETVES